MPSITLKTNISVNSSLEDKIKTALGKAIETIPGKTERWLMVIVEDEKKMRFAGSDSPCAIAEVGLLGSASETVYNKMTEVLCKELSGLLSIPEDRIYTNYSEFKYWGWNGENF